MGEPAKQLRRSTPELEALVNLFYPTLGALARFEEVESADLPAVYRRLLDHDEHMTVKVEAHHGSPVDVEVLRTNSTPTHYSRVIVLKRRSDGMVVQFGIVRLTLSFLGSRVRQEIEGRTAPLGRILIEHNVLRNVRLLSLWKIIPGEELRELLCLDEPETCYGRTALIYCNGVPAVELLEVVTPA